MIADPPPRFDSVEHLEEFLSIPQEALRRDLADAPGDILVLGAGGKMGPTLAMLARHAAPGRRVIGVARFSEKGLRERLKRAEVETIACDLLDRAAMEALPRAPNVICMIAYKFGAAGNEPMAWAVNRPEVKPRTRSSCPTGEPSTSCSPIGRIPKTTGPCPTPGRWCSTPCHRASRQTVPGASTGPIAATPPTPA